MHFLLCSTTDTNVDQSAPPNAELSAAIGKMGEEMARAGNLVVVGSLFPVAAGTRVRLEDGKVAVTDGPLTEARELVGGWVLIRADSKEEAVQLATRFQEAHREVFGDGYVGETEIRQVLASWQSWEAAT